mmetsp:Transcript_5421/g.7242  ORF Transcript_5421/g.7242 Transcript_5421/m.7242 type:complete len:115 (-) Transcript_5421:278-622(-)|eukprot:CAMPEP_0185597878 /NCGR_PEP_ID=MMETSP0434-20130131/81639_1 /TAXON_ID=626734 ORGANISM="Favella taraikaensis, Strain Fe Narragansett Bay" /NCGR_SAMPLE_ID=MMETSP0434 /ASSEMBLY_ACC=CAM_ASM_000379 /LENGTH=114 /DNA_ID=CAMNT_0028226711 /DNA_START=2346 /DNA_END=2690 /DNA_ORIENTATION=-
MSNFTSNDSKFKEQLTMQDRPLTSQKPAASDLKKTDRNSQNYVTQPQKSSEAVTEMKDLSAKPGLSPQRAGESMKLLSSSKVMKNETTTMKMHESDILKHEDCSPSTLPPIARP